MATETIADILREMRGYADKQERMSFYDLRNLATETLRVFADRIEAAAKREKPAISEDCKRSKYERLHECFWDKRAVQCVIRQMLDERDDLSSIDSVSANRMDYFANQLIGIASDDGKSFNNNAKMREVLLSIRGIVNVYNYKFIKTHVSRLCDETLAAPPEPVGNAAKMREALEAVVEVGYPHNFQREAPHIRGYCYDITKAIEKCFTALAAPPRNCDKCPTPKDAMLAHLAEVYEGEKVEFGDYEWCEFVQWLFAEAEGGNNEQK